MTNDALKSELRESAIIMANLPIEFGVACITDAGAQRISKALTDAATALEAMVTSSADMKGENVVLLGLLTDCAAVLRTIDPDDSDEAEKLAELLGAIDRAQAPTRHHPRCCRGGSGDA
jgi:hypothetical protein